MELLLGPMLRYVDDHQATIWVETDVPCEVTIRDGRAHTFEIEQHHYALVVLSDLEAGTCYEYTVALDGLVVWPKAESGFPLPALRTTAQSGRLCIQFGSCRVAAPNKAPFTSVEKRERKGRGIDSLHALAVELCQSPAESWPDIVLFLGDQVYADGLSPETARFIRKRRGPKSEPRNEVADFEEYTRLYRESWAQPAVRWLLSSLPTAMIFDDHDMHDDWNTSKAWRDMMWRKPWWKARIVGGIMSYWIYQHIGNLSPQELDADPLFRSIQAEGDHGPPLREFALEADQHPERVRWSYRRDWGRIRLLMIDSRAARVLSPGHRDLLDPQEWAWLEAQLAGDLDHLLLGTSLPYLLPHAIHDVEVWDEAICDGAWGPPGRWLGEQIRRAVDLEHWGAFYRSFERLTALVRGVAGGAPGRPPPATIIALSGDVHYAYLAEAELKDPADGGAKLYQIVCSPLRNKIEKKILLTNKFATSRFGQWLGRTLARTANADAGIDWAVTDGPWFGNEIAELRFDGRQALFFIRAAKLAEGEVVQLKEVGRKQLS